IEAPGYSTPGIYSLSVPRGPLGGGEGRGEVGDSRARADTHLTLPRLRRGPLPLPPTGRRGISSADIFRSHRNRSCSGGRTISAAGASGADQERPRTSTIGVASAA